MVRLIDGKSIAQKVREKIRLQVVELAKKRTRPPGLAVVLVGENPASQVYVRNKTRACEQAGFHHEQINLPSSVSEARLVETIETLNLRPEIDGILLQLPLPAHIEERNLLPLIHPDKDVDGFHPVNMGKLVIGEPGHVACTPLGVLRMLQEENIDMRGRHVVVLGRSNIVGKPMALLSLLKRPGANGTVTVCHSGTRNLASLTRQADILIAAIGRARFVTIDMVGEGAVVIDVGINRGDQGELCGDVDFEAVQHQASAITPVPGGVGPMTIAMLLSNTLDAYQKNTLSQC